MRSLLPVFEQIVRRSHLYTEERVTLAEAEHPFDTRNIHPKLPSIVRRMFDDGYYSQATFEACKYLDKEVGRLAECHESGYRLMMRVFNEEAPVLKIAPLRTTSDRDEQLGYKHIFAGTSSGIRNPRGHEHSVPESVDECLDHLSLVSLLLRKLESAGFCLAVKS
jgi:uncharacterized protein (TIGR02391 family)